MKRKLLARNVAYAVLLASVCSCAGPEKKKEVAVRTESKTASVKFFEGVSTGLRYTLGIPMFGVVSFFAMFAGGPAVLGKFVEAVENGPKTPEEEGVTAGERFKPAGAEL